MRLLIVAAVSAGLLASPAFASSSTDAMKTCNTKWSGMTAAEKTATPYKGFMSDCMKTPTGLTTQTPVPAGATGKCKDGTYTMAKTHQGACSTRGGVDSWITH
jgi:hypothetical protein